MDNIKKNSAVEKTENIANGGNNNEGHEIRQQRAENRLNEKRNNNNNKRNAWLAAVVTLSVAVLVLGGLLTFAIFTPIDDQATSTQREQQSFYELVGYVDAMDVNLSKAVVSGDNQKRQKLFNDIRVQSNLATESISSLTIEDEDKYYTTKFINQVGDYCKYLSEKLIDGEELSSLDVETLKSMHKINASIKESLSKLASKIDENYDFKSLYEGKDSDMIISQFSQLESNAVDYPHMIYDGAFSDGTEGDVAKALDGKEEITKMQAEKLFKEYFSSYKIKNVELVGESKGKVIETYNFEGVDEDGVTLMAQITKKGGMLAEFNYFKDCSNDNLDLRGAEELASEFIKKIGYTNMKAVWTADSGNTITINFASLVNGVICYSDLVKVNVCRERAVVSGLEASSYIYNHTEREPKTAVVSVNQVKGKVSSEIEIDSVRLAIIPKGQTQEILAYEFTGTKNGTMYYIYIDAVTGKEADIFMVIDTTEGKLLM